MSLQPLIAAVVGALILSAAGMTHGVSINSRVIALLSALAFVVVVLVVAWRVNRPAWSKAGATEPGLLFHTMRRNMRLAALVYAWAAAAFFAIYTLTEIRWQHGLQYGTAAALIAAGFLYFVHKLGADGASTSPAPWLNTLHGLSVTAGLFFLLLSGKMQSAKGDWPANYIFLFGGIALVWLCYFAFVTQRRHRIAAKPA